MAFKKPYNEKNLKKNNVKVKNSYYTFSKDYPIGNLTKRKTTRKKENKILFRKIAVSALCFVLIALLSFFVTETGLKFSFKDPPVSETQQTTGDAQPTEIEASALSVKAFFLPEEKISDTKYVKKLISKIKRYDAKSVVIGFKTKDGHLAYSSKSSCTIGVDCALYDNETVRKNLSLFKSKNIDVIAQIYCFEDPLMSSANSDLAVKYLDTDVSWLDDTEEDSGKTWLNPYSKKARNYLLDVIDEVSSFGVSGFILRSVSFPDKGSSDTAGYPGEKEKSQRNDVLLEFIKSVKEKVSPDHFVLISQNVDDTLGGNEGSLFGTLTTCAADGFCADIESRGDEYIIDKKSGYSSILSLFSKLEKAVGDKEKLVAEIHEKELSYSFLRALSKNGYDNFIIYN